MTNSTESNQPNQNEQSQVQYKREIEGLELLSKLEGKIIEVDIDLSGLFSTLFMEKLEMEDADDNIILSSGIDDLDCIHILKEQIVSIEEEYENKLVIYMLHGDITINVL